MSEEWRKTAELHERMSKLEERVFVSHSETIKGLTTDVRDITKRINWLLIVLSGNFGVQFVKAMIGH